MKKNNKVTLITTESLASNGPRIISSYLKKHDFKVQLISLSTLNNSFSEEVLRNILELSKDSLLICFSCTSISSEKTIQIIKYVRQLKIPLIWGGVHATLNPEKCLKHVDFVCIGEGEEAILELAVRLQKKEDVTKIKNLWINKNNTIYKNEIRPLIKNLNKLPFPDYNLENQYVLMKNKIIRTRAEHMRYGEHNLSNNLLITTNNFITSHTIRGCPYTCEFCCNYDLKKLYKNKGKYVRMRDVKNIIGELIHLKQKLKNLEFIWFTDDDFFLRSHDEISRFATIYRKKINLPFMCYINPLSLKENKLKLLLKSNLRYLEVGIQTGDQELNEKIYNRTQANKVILEVSRTLNKYESRRFTPVYQIIYMNPLENEKSILRTIRLIQSLPKPFFLKVFNMIFFQGSSLYKKSKKILDDSLINTDTLNLINYYDYITHAKLKQEKNLYLNLIIHSIAGWNTKHRAGIIPNLLLNFLLLRKVIDFNRKFNFVNKGLLFFPTISNILWFISMKHRGWFLENITMNLFKFKKKAILSFSKLLEP